MAKYLYLKVCPRGFANELTYYRIDKSDEKAIKAAKKEIANYDTDTSGYAEWTSDKRASIPGVAIDWELRDF
jgi:hypothetical protein